MFVPSSLLILLHLSCLFVSLSLTRSICTPGASRLPNFRVRLSSVNRTDGQSNGKSKLKVCFCEVRFVKRKHSIQELKVTVFPTPHPPPPIRPLKNFPQFTHRPG